MKNRIKLNAADKWLTKYLRVARRETQAAIKRGDAVVASLGSTGISTKRKATQIAKRLGFTFNDFAVASLMIAIDNDPEFRRERKLKRYIPGRCARKVVAA